MADTASISALLSASAVVGALTTSQVVTWYVETSQLKAEVRARSSAQERDDAYTQELKARQNQLTSKQRALLWVAGIQWAVVTSLLLLALCLSNPWREPGFQSGLLPFFVAAWALVCALVVVPLIITTVSVARLRAVSPAIGPPDTARKTK